MLTMTRSAVRLARRTSDRCPSWSAPIVGTNASVSPRARSLDTAARSWTSERTRGMRVRARAGRPFTLSRSRSVALGIRGEAPRLDVGHVARERVARGGTQLGVAADELRLVTEVEPEQVVRHQHLAVALDAGADADRRDRELARDRGAQACRDALQHEREAAGAFERLRV